jgi:hypothetical protein
VNANVDYVQLYTVTSQNLDSPSCAKNRNQLGAGTSLPSWDLQGIRKAFNIFANLTADSRFATSSVLLENYGIQGVRAIDSSSTSLAPEERERPVLTGPSIWWDGNDKQTEKDANVYAQDIRNALSMGIDKNNQKRHYYVNYASGVETKPEMYGYDSRLERLQKLKKELDPKNRFGFYNPVV